MRLDAPAASGITPSQEDFCAAARRGSILPVYREVVADGDTPVSAYAKLGGRDYSFLLESVVGGEKWAAYSFIGVAPRAVLRVRGGRASFVRNDIEAGGPPGEEESDAPDPALALAALLAPYRAVVTPGLPRFFGGAVGYLGYDAARAWERLPSHAVDDLGLPEAIFVVTDTLVIFDNLRQTVKLVACAFIEEDAGEAAVVRAWRAAVERIDALESALRRPLSLRPLPGPGDPTDAVALESSMTRDAYLDGVRRAREHILAGDAFQIVLAQRFAAPREGADPFDVYRALRVINPSPYMFHLQLPEVVVTGASPETLVRLEAGRVEVRPIAGTRPRGRDAVEDARLEEELRADEKERAEHVMLIDLGRNDVGRVARVGTVRVEETMAVERYSHVMHMVSLVTGELDARHGPLDVLRAAFPAGTLSGAPKIRAMQIIEELEPVRRGIYGGAVGYVSFATAGTNQEVGGAAAPPLAGCNLDLAIAIRTLVTRGDRVYVQAGAGIVYDSIPEREYDETVAKARAVVRAVALAREARRREVEG